jgi:hypothetical protein
MVRRLKVSSATPYTSMHIKRDARMKELGEEMKGKILQIQYGTGAEHLYGATFFHPTAFALLLHHKGVLRLYRIVFEEFCLLRLSTRETFELSPL